jgi:hypothetical protein
MGSPQSSSLMRRIMPPTEQPRAMLHRVKGDGEGLGERGPGRRGCLIPDFDGAFFAKEWKDALWVKYSTGAPQRQRRSVARSSIVKRA